VYRAHYVHACAHFIQTKMAAKWKQDYSVRQMSEVRNVISFLHVSGSFSLKENRKDVR
jgi:hypothetical protein